MNISARSYLTAGVAAVGASAIALAPVQPLDAGSTPVPNRAISDLAVGLAAAVTPVDPIQNIVDVIAATAENLEALFNDWAGGLYVNGTIPTPPNTVLNGNLGNRTGGYATGTPLPIVQQVVSNWITYFGELPDIGGIPGQIVTNLGNAFFAPTTPGENLSGRIVNLLPSDFYNQNVNAVPYIDTPLGTLTQRDLGALLPVLLGDGYAGIEPIVNFATTPISGLLVGAIGPIVAPVLAVVNGISNAVALLQESDFGGALTELVNIPANTVNALLNGGQVLDLTGVLGLFGVTLPDEVTSLGLQMGGLLSPGGVALDALATEAVIPNFADIVVSGLPVGPIGALVSLTNYVARSIVVTPPAETLPVEQDAAGSVLPEVLPDDKVVPAPLASVAAAPAATTPAIDTVQVAVTAPAAEVPAADVMAVEATAAAAAHASAPEVTPVEVEAPESAPAPPVAAQADTTPAAPQTARAGRSGDAGAGASTPKRSARGAAARG